MTPKCRLPNSNQVWCWRKSELVGPAYRRCLARDRVAGDFHCRRTASDSASDSLCYSGGCEYLELLPAFSFILASSVENASAYPMQPPFPKSRVMDYQSICIAFEWSNNPPKPRCFTHITPSIKSTFCKCLMSLRSRASCPLMCVVGLSKPSQIGQKTIQK